MYVCMYVCLCVCVFFLNKFLISSTCLQHCSSFHSCMDSPVARQIRLSFFCPRVVVCSCYLFFLCWFFLTKWYCGFHPASFNNKQSLFNTYYLFQLEQLCNFFHECVKCASFNRLCTMMDTYDQHHNCLLHEGEHLRYT